jgi:hypothetical protein
MIPIHVERIDSEHELRFGWASWDDGSHTSRSVKYMYRAEDGRWSRSSPEVPLDRLVQMVLFVKKVGGLDDDLSEQIRATFCPRRPGK